MDETGLTAKVEAGLRQDVEDRPEVVRAAADQLQRILDAGTHVSEDQEAIEQIQQEIATLRARLKS